MKNFINEAEEDEGDCYGNDDYGEYDEGRNFFFLVLLRCGDIFVCFFLILFCLFFFSEEIDKEIKKKKIKN